MMRTVSLLGLVAGLMVGMASVSDAQAHKSCCKGKKSCPTHRATPGAKATPDAKAKPDGKTEAKACKCHGHDCGSVAHGADGAASCSATDCASDCPGHAS